MVDSSATGAPMTPPKLPNLASSARPIGLVSRQGVGAGFQQPLTHARSMARGADSAVVVLGTGEQVGQIGHVGHALLSSGQAGPRGADVRANATPRMLPIS
jgi:hypothetical protein